MPRKLRPEKRRRQPAELHPSVVEFLITGSTERAQVEINPLVKVILNDAHAVAARRAWAVVDEAAAVAALRRCSASWNLFVGKDGHR